MTRRTTSAGEREEFKIAFEDARPMKPVTAPRARKPLPNGKIAEPSGIDGGTARELRKGSLEPQARLDLHGLTETVAHRALTTFVLGAQSRGLRFVLIVTGKGAREVDDSFDMGRPQRGILKSMAPRWLKEPELARHIADIRTAHRRHGGDGALYVYLRKRDR